MKHLIYNCECEVGIPKLPDESIDLVVTSPPYNVDLGNNKYNSTPYDIYRDNKDHKEYIWWLTTVFQILYPKLRRGGRICLNIGDGSNGRVPTHSDMIQALASIGYIPYTMAIWDKGQTSNRAAWGSYLSPSCPSLPFGFEYVIVMAKEDRKLQWKGTTDLTKEEFVEWTNPFWKIQPQTDMKKWNCPAVFPEELPTRCIKMFSWVGAVVLDPFCGVATTGVACKRLNRSFIGFEISKDYCMTGLKRLQEIGT